MDVHIFPAACVLSIKLSADDVALSLAVLNGASFVGRLAFETFSDVVIP